MRTPGINQSGINQRRIHRNTMDQGALGRSAELLHEECGLTMMSTFVQRV
jgi:hypothetical protein